MVTVRATGAQEISPEQYQQLQYRHIGPVGNRVSAVVGVPGNPLIYYVGAASGGIWKSEDGGEYWRPIFDGESDHSIGALAVAPSGVSAVLFAVSRPSLLTLVLTRGLPVESEIKQETFQLRR